uniref:Uncharacterized protein n=1 Tax=Plectus sambesii TaxID=2011161 RepID=A0A914VZ70_9BILA
MPNTILMFMRTVDFNYTVVQSEVSPGLDYPPSSILNIVLGTSEDYDKIPACPPKKIAYAPNTTVTNEIMKNLASRYFFKAPLKADPFPTAGAMNGALTDFLNSVEASCNRYSSDPVGTYPAEYVGKHYDR